MDSARSCQCSDSLALSHRGSGEEPAGNRLLAGNPNPSPASRKPGDLLGSAAPEAREGFGYGFGPESALGSLSAHPGPFSTDRPLLGPPQLLPRDRSSRAAPECVPGEYLEYFSLAKSSSSPAASCPCPGSSAAAGCCPRGSWQGNTAVPGKRRQRRCGGERGRRHARIHQSIPFYCFQYKLRTAFQRGPQHVRLLACNIWLCLQNP